MIFCVRQMFVMLVIFRRIVTSHYAFPTCIFNEFVDTFPFYCCKYYVNFAMICTAYFNYFIIPTLFLNRKY